MPRRVRMMPSEPHRNSSLLTKRLLFDLCSLPYAFLTSQRTWRDHAGQLAVLSGVRTGDWLLDVGCGSGESAFGMVERLPGLHVIGLDFSGTMIRIARFRSRFHFSKAQLHFQQCDAMQLPFAAATFDAVTGHSVLYLLSNPEQVLKEVHRVLKPGGKCAFLEPAACNKFPFRVAKRLLQEPRFVVSMALWRVMSRHYGRFDRARFSRAFLGAGLELICVEPTLNGLGVIGIGRAPSLANPDTSQHSCAHPQDAIDPI
jgi:ubiquinone/menaquinone biosynthesis C-methylase UbiE